MQGSGTFGVESVLTSVVGKDDRLLIAANGAYGLRMESIAQHAGPLYLLYAKKDCEQPDASEIAEILAENPDITHVSMVHSETTSGILNDIRSVGEVVKRAGCTFIVDAMSSFGGVDIPTKEWGIDFMISSANKCIRESRDFLSSSPNAVCWRRAPERRAVCLSICMISGRLWKKMENGVSPVLHT